MVFSNPRNEERYVGEDSSVANGLLGSLQTSTALHVAEIEVPRSYIGPIECGTGPAMQRVRRLIEQSTASDLPVLITGEVGVGRDLVAREIHRRSSRRDGPFIEINCALLQEESFESKLLNGGMNALGTAEGSVAGQAENVTSATVFLDAIGELSPALQVGLLQTLRRDDALKSGNGDHRIAFRLISATSHDLTPSIEAGTFSEDLYYRVNLIHIGIPPLRAHREDIPALSQYFVQKHRTSQKWPDEIPASLLDRFRSYEWPGNISELENAIQRLIALRDPAYVLEELEARSAPIDYGYATASSNGAAYPAFATAPQAAGDNVDLKALGRRAADIAEHEAIIKMLNKTMGNKKEAAQRLGISYKALLYKIRDFGIVGSDLRTNRRESTRC
jgi:two-component system, NtrC family, response regulator AtoC